MYYLGVIQLNYFSVYHIHFLCNMDESSSTFQMPKTFDEQKELVINSVLKSTVYKNK